MNRFDIKQRILLIFVCIGFMFGSFISVLSEFHCLNSDKRLQDTYYDQNLHKVMLEVLPFEAVSENNVRIQFLNSNIKTESNPALTGLYGWIYLCILLSLSALLFYSIMNRNHTVKNNVQRILYYIHNQDGRK